MVVRSMPHISALGGTLMRKKMRRKRHGLALKKRFLNSEVTGNDNISGRMAVSSLLRLKMIF